VDCLNEESSTWNVGKDPMPLKMRMVDTALDYLKFVYETRLTEGDKSLVADTIPTNLNHFSGCGGVAEFLPKVNAFIAAYKSDEQLDTIMPRDVISYMGYGQQLLDCAFTLRKNGYSAASANLYAKVVGIDASMLMADAHVENNLKRALAIPAVQTQPIVIRYGPKSCTGHVWGDENYRTIDWDCN
jgi:hypothetical protein